MDTSSNGRFFSNGTSEDESLDDLVGNEDVEKLVESFETVVAIANYESTDETHLNFEKGQRLTVLSKETNNWWWGELEGSCGYIPVNHVTTEQTFKHQNEWQDEEYFASYGQLNLQLEMLNDRPRTLAYRKAIQQNASFLNGKTVLDVGCGSGILSLFCARDGGAKKVYSIEASDVADLALEVVQSNNLDDTISVLKGKVEDIELPEKVDLIISEWMGTFLVFEYMIESVLYARDQWLKPEGTTWPSRAKLYLAPCSAEKHYEEKISVWNEQYGFDFSPFKKKAKEEFLSRPFYDYELDKTNCLSDSAVLLDLDLNFLTIDELQMMSGEFRFKITKDGPLHGVCSWFSVTFGQVPTVPSEDVTLSTGPDEPLTHWKQNLFLLDNPVNVFSGNVIIGSAVLKRNLQYKRHLTVNFCFDIFSDENNLTNDNLICKIEKQYHIWT